MRSIINVKHTVTLCALCVAGAVSAGPLDLDATFNSTGALSANYSDYTGSDSRTYFEDVETTPDGHIIAVGSATNTSSAYDGLIVKIRPDGTLDPSFDSDGKRFISLSDDTRIEKVATLFDGKLLVLARTRNTGGSWRIELLRLNEDGSIDSDFGPNGKYTVPYPSGRNIIPKDLAVLSTGEAVILFNEYFRTSIGTDQYYSKAAKVSESGYSRPFSLNGNGYISPSIIGPSSAHSAEFNHLALDSSDNIYMSGRFLGIVNTAYVPNISMLNGKFDSNGNPQTFGTFTTGNGRAFWYLHPDLSSTAPSSVPTDNNTLSSIVALPNGDVVSAGCNPDGQARIQRQTSSGALVTSFGVNGVQTYDILPSDECFSEVAYHPTLGLILMGSNTANAEQMILQIDESTGSVINQRAGGVFFTSNGNNHGGIAEAITILGNGKIVVAATTGVSNPSANDVQGALRVYEGAALTPSTTRLLNPLNFAADTNVALSTQMTSNSETATITGSGSLSAHTAGGQLLVNGSLISITPTTVNTSDSLQLMHTSAYTANTDKTTYLRLSSGTGAHRSNNQWKSGDAISSYTSTSMNGDTTPDAYDLQPTSVGLPPEINVVVTSSTVTISGIDIATPISITNGEYSVNGGAYTSASGIVNNGDTVQVRHTTANAYSTLTTTTLDIGGVTDTFVSTTKTLDTVPNAFSLQPTVTGLPPELSVVVTSNTITVSGINTATPISITDGEYSINGGAFTNTAGTVNNGDTVQVRHTTANAYSTLTTTTLDIGGVTDTFVSTTKTLDTTPNAYSLQPTVVGLPPEPSVVAVSNTITVSGINSAAPISIVNGEYRVNSGAFTSTAGTVNNGDTVQVRHTTASTYGTLTTSTLDIGGVTDTFLSTTRSADTIADNLPAFIDYSGSAPAPNELITFSNALTITGIDVAIPISISAAVSAEYSINGGTFTSNAGTVSNNDVISVRYPAAATHNSQLIIGLAIGANQVTNFRSTTAAQDNTPDVFSFVAQNDVDPNTTITSAATSISGFNTTISISITNGEYSINGGGFTSQSGTVESGDQLVVRHTSSANTSETITTEVTVGGVSASFSSTTSAVNGGTGSVSGATSTSGASFGAIWLAIFMVISVFRRKH
ncbi:putative Large exoprotein involved in heme utilization or adhesion [Vibrio nigripulchritudo MADA3029]|uniref:delta-60 repeat domain-containing protein n=1 Tax=Vibrio nigripulchritudo TaxID=28173 RepID=UPI0003B186EC|nr:delta-60 repeat domain-containing protein [Vibrio nigripulchritudo]CCN45972.1 putative Large exoprotein involved in heme utilization or adhesion [Vibrio nigripulchritudo MADA3020]CCN55240.1 putative Large exoprotein involved in heme utilization or adhesion [Vibrio nigripulchritudo MADA3021]CCN62361.1 putative Large exoprotein involved in heme utilization or adhesion [Vibrio nigripulchritudo MADA3029]